VSAEHAAALVDALLHLHQANQVEWDPSGGEGPVKVTAARAVLCEAAKVAIDEAGERLSGLCTALLRGEGSLAEVGAQVEALSGLLDLLREADGDAAAP
jgi:hypothetical protein